MSNKIWNELEAWNRWGMLEAMYFGRDFDCPGLTLTDKNALLNGLKLRGFVRKAESHEEGSWVVTQDGVALLKNTTPPEKPELPVEKPFCPAQWHKGKAPVVVVACPDCGELPALSVQHKMDLKVKEDEDATEIQELTLRTRDGKEIRTGLILPRGYKVNIVDAKDGRVELVPEKKRVRFTEARFEDLLARIIKKYAPVMPSAEADDIGWLVNLVAEQRKLLRDAKVGFEAMEQGVHFSGLEKATLGLINESLEEWNGGKK